MTRLSILALVLLAGSACSTPNRIVGGWATTLQRWPFIVAMEFYRRDYGGTWTQSCAGNILTAQYVLSAAHCLTGTASNRRFRAGSIYRNVGGTVHVVQWYRNHPSYGQGLGLDADISVSRLQRQIGFSANVAPGVIPSQGARVPDGAAVRHAGWGATSQGGGVSGVLLETEIYTVNNAFCRQLYAGLRPNPTIITQNMICAQYPGGGRDACQGDSGGPLTYGNIIVGVVSGGHGCANETYPGVSTAVSSYTSWILSNTV